MDWFLSSKSVPARVLRALSLPVAIIPIGIGALMTDSLADGTPQPGFRTDLWQYVKGGASS